MTARAGVVFQDAAVHIALSLVGCSLAEAYPVPKLRVLLVSGLAARALGVGLLLVSLPRITTRAVAGPAIRECDSIWAICRVPEFAEELAQSAFNGPQSPVYGLLGIGHKLWSGLLSTSVLAQTLRVSATAARILAQGLELDRITVAGWFGGDVPAPTRGEVPFYYLVTDPGELKPVHPDQVTEFLPPLVRRFVHRWVWTAGTPAP